MSGTTAEAEIHNLVFWHLLRSFFRPEARRSAGQHGNGAPGWDPPASALSTGKALQVGKPPHSHSPSALQRTRGSGRAGEAPAALTCPGGRVILSLLMLRGSRVG